MYDLCYPSWVFQFQKEDYYFGKHTVIREFADVFPKNISGLPLKRDIYFTIELIPGEVPVSKSPYDMSIPELTELKMKL